MFELMTFRLIDGTDESVFLDADKRLQSDFAYQQPGLVRRTTARGVGDRQGEWIVIELWISVEAADACAGRRDSDPTVQEFMALVDRASVEIRRYADLDA